MLRCVPAYSRMKIVTHFLAAFLFPSYMKGPADPLLPLSGWIIGAAVNLLPDRRQNSAITRALRGRQPISAALSGYERLSRIVGERSWWALFGEALVWGLFNSWIGIHLAYNQGSLFDYILLLICTGLLVASLARIIRKWDFERRQRISDHAASIRT